MCARAYVHVRLHTHVHLYTAHILHTHTPHKEHRASQRTVASQPRPLLVVGPHATHILFTIARFCEFPRSRFIHKFITALPPGGRVRDRMSVNYTLQGLCLRHALNPRRKCVCLS